MATQQQQPANQVLQLQLQGLYTNPNLLSAVPEGSMNQADNIVFTSPNIAESRRGQQVYGTTLTAPPDGLYIYRETNLVHSNDGTLWYDSDGLGTWVAYTGTYDPPSEAIVIRSLEQNKNFYFTTSNGVYKLDSITGEPVLAGAPPALGGLGSTSGTTGWFLTGTNVAYQIVWGYTDANNNLILGAPSPAIIVSNPQVNVTGNTDGTTAVLTGLSATGAISPGMYAFGTGIQVGATVVSVDSSTQVTISEDTNSAETNEPMQFGFDTNASISFAIPQGLTTNWFYQIYRSQMSANISTSPGPEYAQVYQANLTSANIAAGYITITDITPEDLKGTLLYTNPSQLGATAAQYQPPLAADMCFFLGYTFYSNTIGYQSIELTLLGAGNGVGLSYVDITGDINNSTTITGLSSTTNLRVGMRVVGTDIPLNATIVSINTGASSMVISAATTGGSHSTVALECQDSITIGPNTFYAGSSSLGNQFEVSMTGDPAIDIQITANTLADVVNLYNGPTIYAYYESGFSGAPGQLLFEASNLNESTFYVTSTNSTAFNPNLPLTGTTVASDNSTNPNYLWYSNFDQPEAVPLTNFIPVGSADYPIQRILALRTSVIIFKQDGIFRLFGTTPSQFTIFPIDYTAILNAPETARVFNNQVYYNSVQGVASLSDNSTPVIISIPISDQLNAVSTYSAFETTSFGVSYDGDRTYLLGTVTNSYDTYATQIFAFNYLTNAWTRWPINRSCGLVNQFASGDGLLYMGNPASNQVYQERKNFNITDFADEQYTVTVTGYSGYVIAVADSSDASIGMTFGQSGLNSVITAVPDSTHITVADLFAWANGTAYVYTPIQNQCTFNPIIAGNAGLLKHFRECTFLFKNAAFDVMEIGFSSDFAPSIEKTNIYPISQGSWGNFNFGTQPWGGQLGGFQAIRTYTTMNQSRGHWLNIQCTTDQAFTNFTLLGVSVMIEPVSERMR